MEKQIEQQLSEINEINIRASTMLSQSNNQEELKFDQDLAPQEQDLMSFFNEKSQIHCLSNENVMKVSREYTEPSLDTNFSVEGELMKNSPSPLKSWQRRYFQFRDNQLRYWKSKTDFLAKKHAAGIIPFDRVKVDLQLHNNLGFDLALNGCKRVFKLKAYNQIDFNNWTQILQNAILNSRGYLENLQIDDSYFSLDFWRYGLIDHDEFLKNAQTGDLLLFRGSHVAAKLTRGWTKGNIDHVAMVVRFEKFNTGEIFFLESNMDRGVCFRTWSDFVDTNTIYNQIFVRKLICNRDKEFYDKFEEFLDQVQGNTYQLNLSKILFGQKRQNSIAENNLEKRKFFCSELVAKGYKELGLLKTEKASGQYMPIDLSCLAQNPIILVEGAELKDDQIILIKKVQSSFVSKK